MHYFSEGNPILLRRIYEIFLIFSCFKLKVHTWTWTLRYLEPEALSAGITAGFEYQFHNHSIRIVGPNWGYWWISTKFTDSVFIIITIHWERQMKIWCNVSVINTSDLHTSKTHVSHKSRKHYTDNLHKEQRNTWYHLE